MTDRPLELAISLWGDRHVPSSVTRDLAIEIEASGAADGLLFCDMLPHFIPTQLWTTEHTPLASVLKDPDSNSDAFALAAYVMGAVPSLKLTVSTDSIRHPPAELVQTMLTLANITEGKASFQVGGGEVKQCKAYGHKRSQGMSRMEDLLKIFHLLTESDGPVDFQGRHWTFDRASIGSAIPAKPPIFALGGGPQLLDYATSYCDGVAVTCPPVWTTPEEFAEARQGILRQVEQKGRDPEKFKFAMWAPVLMHESPEIIEKALDNTCVKWMSATWGRIGPHLWERDGLESPVPEGWFYFQKLLPHATDDSFIDEVLSKTTREHSRVSWINGTVDDVAGQLEQWVEAGFDWVCPMDFATTLALGVEEAQASMRRTIEVCQALRARAASSLTAV
jgi:phthiodiolone/phenolphthiodiolone dimycocerosates ketoreductase